MSVWDDKNAVAMRTPVAVFFCPSRRQPVHDRNFDNNSGPPVVVGKAAGGDYAANAGTFYGFTTPIGGQADPRKAGPIHTFSAVRMAQVTDGLSTTFAVGERHIPPANPAWRAEMVHFEQADTAFFAADMPQVLFRDVSQGLAAGPADPSVVKFGSGHAGVTNFVFLDGHAEPVANDTDRDLLLTRAAFGDGTDPATVDDGRDGGTCSASGLLRIRSQHRPPRGIGYPCDPCGPATGHPEPGSPRRPCSTACLNRWRCSTPPSG